MARRRDCADTIAHTYQQLLPIFEFVVQACMPAG